MNLLPIPTTVFLAIGTLLGSADLATAAESRKPNVIVIVADDLGYADVGVHGLKEVPTPHIDSIAANGVRCTSGYVSGTYCSPTRAGLLTGRYQQRFGHEFNPHKGDPGDLGLPVSETTFADRMKAIGYTTAAIGKWHLGVAEKFHPLKRGFDEFYGFVGGARSYFPSETPKNVTGQAAVTALTHRGPVESQGKPIEWEGYLTDRLADAAGSFIQRNRAQPFFLYLAFNAVHTPMDATDEYLARVKDVADPQRRTYLAMLAGLDDAVGQVLAKVKEAKLEEQTLIVFISDNGGPIDKYAVNGSSNGPLRGSKGDSWEGGVRVPFFVQWKGTLPAGKTYDQPVIQLDLLPTAIAAAGGSVDSAWKLDGVNLLPFFKRESEAAPHEALYWRMGNVWGIRSGKWKIAQTYRSGEAKLFDLSTDIAEANDLRPAHPDVYDRLRKQWEAWNAQLISPRWEDPNPDPYGRAKGRS